MKQGINCLSLYLSVSHKYYPFHFLQQRLFMYVTIPDKLFFLYVYTKWSHQFVRMWTILLWNELWIEISIDLVTIFTFSEERQYIYLYLSLRTFLPLICMLSKIFTYIQNYQIFLMIIWRYMFYENGDSNFGTKDGVIISQKSIFCDFTLLVSC